MYSLHKKITNLETFIFVIFILIPLSVIFSRFLLNVIIIGFFLFLIFRSFKNKNWTFIKSRDDDYQLISEYIGNKLDIIYLDTMHTADHVEKIINF